MARQQVAYNPNTELPKITAQANMLTEQAYRDTNAGNSAKQLADALGIVSVNTQALADQDERRRIQEQALKIEHYTETFMQDHAGGAVSQAQVKERFPETVPIIAARIAGEIGKGEGEKSFASVVEAINSDDNLRLNTQARNDFIKQKRMELFGNIPKDNEFYSGGFVKGIDKQLSSYEHQWATQTAAYHGQVEVKGFSDDVVATLQSGGDLVALDAKWGRSSSLNNLERSKLVIDTVTKQAFASDDPQMLERIPGRFLNAETKASLRQTAIQITNQRFSNLRNNEYLKTTQRDEQLRASKVGIIDTLVSGGQVDAAQYRDNPEAFQFALQMRETSTLDASLSSANSMKIKHGLFVMATTGDSVKSVSELTDDILKSPNINPSDKQALIKELPKLIEGQNLMRDDDVRQPIVDRLNPRLTELSSSTNQLVATFMSGRNLRSEVMKNYDMDIRRSFLAEYEETGKWP